jgi:arylsulfatase
VEPIANQVQRVIIGSEHENPMTLSACEWRDVFVDQQQQVRMAERKNSYWDLDVAQAGMYRFELRRWPRESGLALREACGETQFTDGSAPAGVSMPIARARLMIDRRTFVQEASPDAQSVAFEVALDAGQTLLHTWFDDERGQPICGAYYVYVERLARSS